MAYFRTGKKSGTVITQPPLISSNLVASSSPGYYYMTLTFDVSNVSTFSITSDAMIDGFNGTVTDADTSNVLYAHNSWGHPAYPVNVDVSNVNTIVVQYTNSPSGLNGAVTFSAS